MGEATKTTQSILLEKAVRVEYRLVFPEGHETILSLSPGAVITGRLDSRPATSFAGPSAK